MRNASMPDSPDTSPAEYVWSMTCNAVEHFTHRCLNTTVTFRAQVTEHHLRECQCCSTCDNAHPV